MMGQLRLGPKLGLNIAIRWFFYNVLWGQGAETFPGKISVKAGDIVGLSAQSPHVGALD